MSRVLGLKSGEEDSSIAGGDGSEIDVRDEEIQWRR